MSPNRSSVIIDENFCKLTDKLQSEILSGLEMHLIHCKDSMKSVEYAKYINELLDKRILSLETGYIPQVFSYREREINEYMKKIFLNNVPLLVLSENGDRSYEIIKNLDKLPTVAITASSDWPEKISETKIEEETRKLIYPRPVLLLDEEKGHFTKLEFFNYILGSPLKIYITSIPGVVISIFSSSDKESKTFTIDGHTFISRIHNVNENIQPLFVHSLERNLPYDVIFNSEHWLLSRFFNGQQPKDELSSKAIKILIRSIDNALESVWEIILSGYYERKNEMGRCRDINHRLIGVTRYYPEVFEELNEAVQEFWKEAQSQGIVPLEEKFSGLTLDDLPWFWSCEPK